MIELHNIDCMEYMATLPDKAFDLAIVDPPYGIAVNHNMGRRSGDAPSTYKPALWDNSQPTGEYWIHLQRVSQHWIVWGANHYSVDLSGSHWIVWDKCFGDGLSFAQVELASTNFEGTVRVFRGLPNQDGKRIHPTQKPVALYKWLLKNYAKEGDRILDTHLGSGSIAIACHDMGFDLVGCELDADYYNAACKRLADHQKQEQLFNGYNT